MTTALLEITAKRLGFTTVLSADGRCVGVFSDGDLRRAVERGVDLATVQIKDVMTVGGTHIRSGALAAEAVRIMQDTRINAIVVMAKGQPIGVLNMQDLLQAGVV